MVQLLTAQNWSPLLAEANRVLQSQGVLAIGKTKGPPDGIDAMMRDRLEKLVSGMGMSEPSSDRGAMTEWLKANSSRQLKLRPIDWVEDRTPRDFIHRKQSAARFASFPADLRETALRSLADWAERHIGPLERTVFLWTSTGLKPGQLTKALDGEPVGTVVYRDEEHGVKL